MESKKDELASKNLFIWIMDDVCPKFYYFPGNEPRVHVIMEKNTHLV